MKLGTLISVKQLVEAHAKFPKNIRVLDSSWHPRSTERDAFAEYIDGHIPGAQFFDLEECRDKSSKYDHMLPSPSDFEYYVGHLGINNNTHVVLYENNAAGFYSAPRAWYNFRVFGHHSISLLNGGLPRWIAEKQPVTQETYVAEKENFKATFNPDLVFSLQQILENMKSHTFQLADARPGGRFAGSQLEPSGIPGGHIPGSISIPFKKLMTMEEEMPYQTLLSPEEVKDIFNNNGIDLTKPLVATCGTGNESSLKLGPNMTRTGDYCTEASQSHKSGQPEMNPSHDEPNHVPSTNEQTYEQKRPPIQIVWRNVVLMGILHLSSVYALTLFSKAKPLTLVWTWFIGYASALGITAGAHRLWAHRSYKAKLPFRIMLAFLNSIAFQNDIIEWSRDHRVHHKFSETDADPHNAKRGFFFSHVGWLLVRKHPDVKEKGKTISLDDLYADPVCRIQQKIYVPSVIICSFIMPMMVPYYLWNESLWNAYFISSLFRYCMTLNFTWLVNSAAHMWGNKPYDKRINPSQNKTVAFLSFGEGFHNYHHAFPQDYATSEFGWFFNPTCLFLDIAAFFGQVYDRKTISKDVVQRKKEKYGDGS